MTDKLYNVNLADNTCLAQRLVPSTDGDLLSDFIARITAAAKGMENPSISFETDTDEDFTYVTVHLSCHRQMTSFERTEYIEARQREQAYRDHMASFRWGSS